MRQSLKAVLGRVLRGMNAVRVGALLLRESREDSARWFKVALGQAVASLAIAALAIGVSGPPARAKKSKDKDAVEVKLGGLTVRREKDKPPKVTPAAAPIAVAPAADPKVGSSEPMNAAAVRAKRKKRSEAADRAVEQAALALARRLGAKVEPEVATAQRWSLRLGLPGEPLAVSPPLALPEDAARRLAEDAPLWDLAAAVVDAAVRDDAEDDAQGLGAPVAGAPVPAAGASPVEGASAVGKGAGAAVGASPAGGAKGAGAAVGASPIGGAPVAGAAVGPLPVDGAPGAAAAVGASPVGGEKVTVAAGGAPVSGAPAVSKVSGAPAVAATDEAEPDDDEEPAVVAPQASASGTAPTTPDPAAKGDDDGDEEPERFANWPLLAALARWSGAVLAAQLLVVALTRDHSEVTENALARAVGLPVPPPRTPKVRLDVRWLLRRLQRRMWTTFALIPLSIALSPLLLLVPGLGQVLLSLGAAWLVVVGTTAKDGRAWEQDLAASEPRSVSALRQATERHRALDWFLPRTLVRIHGRFVRRLQGPMNAAEGAPFELAGVALTRTLALIPFVGLLLRPIVPVAVAAFVPRAAASPSPVLEPGAEATASAPPGAALPAASPR